MAIVVSLVFLLALFVTAYALYATIVPAMPRIEALMAEEQPAGKPRMIYFGIDRHTARRMEEAQKLVAFQSRNAAPFIRRAPAVQLSRAA